MNQSKQKRCTTVNMIKIDKQWYFIKCKRLAKIRVIVMFQ